jgi:hypothetical protein
MEEGSTGLNSVIPLLRDSIFRVWSLISSSNIFICSNMGTMVSFCTLNTISDTILVIFSVEEKNRRRGVSLG